MVARPIQGLFPLVLLVLFSSLLAPSSGSDPEKKRCQRECRGISEPRQWKECVHQGLGRSSEREAEREQEEEGVRKEDNPYYFDDESYKYWTRTEQGNFKVLERFAERSKLFKGIDNYRLAVLEAEPETFMLPSHWDADELFYVMNGRGTITLLREENRESHNISRGDVMRIPAGSIVYGTNKARNEKLRIAMLLQSISTPGHIEEFFGAAGRNPETFYTSFSNEVLEAAFNTSGDKLKTLFGSQNKGIFIKITQEQISALSKSTAEGGGVGGWPAQSNKPYNLLEKRPSYSNEYGELYEARADDYEPLRNLDLDVSFANISEASIMAPNYNTRSTKLAIVVEGRGHIEMVSPHRSSERGGQQRVRYQAVRSPVSPGSVFVIPVGYPMAAVAAPDEYLQILCFGTGAENNREYYLAGRNNVLNKLDRVAKELSFDCPAEEVDEILNAQHESVFMARERRQEEERGRHEASSLESFFSF